jgi:hypothetical protein
MFVSLEVALEPDADPESIAETLFDWACMIGTEGISSIDSFDYNVINDA